MNERTCVLRLILFHLELHRDQCSATRSSWFATELRYRLPSIYPSIHRNAFSITSAAAASSAAVEPVEINFARDSASTELQGQVTPSLAFIQLSQCILIWCHLRMPTCMHTHICTYKHACIHCIHTYGTYVCTCIHVYIQYMHTHNTFIRMYVHTYNR